MARSQGKESITRVINGGYRVIDEQSYYLIILIEKKTHGKVSTVRYLATDNLFCFHTIPNNERYKNNYLYVPQHFS